MLVEDLMVRSVVTCDEHDRLRRAEEKLREGRFRHLPILRGQGLIGVISDRDVAAGRAADDDRRVGDLVRGPAITAAPRWPVESAARLMLQHKIGCLPVLDGDRLVGIMTESDIFEYLCRLLGVTEPATRLELKLDDASRELATVVGVVRDHGIPIVSLVTEPSGQPSRSVVLRLGTIDARAVVDGLRRAGIEVLAPSRETP